MLLHWFSTDFEIDVGVIFDDLLILFRSRTQPAKPSSKTIVFTVNVHTHQKNMILDDFHNVFRC